MTAAELAHMLEGKATASGWDARCPAHDDKKASLSIAEGDGGKVLLHCHVGCVLEDIVGKLGLELPDLFPQEMKPPKPKIVAEYDYVDEGGKLLFQVVRFEPKDFRQRKPDGKGGWTWKLGDVRRVPFRLSKVLATAKAKGVVYVVEGEKDVMALEALGLTATTNAGGAEKWRPEFAEAFTGCSGVVVLPDNDEPGRKHAQGVARSVHALGVPVKVVGLPGLAAKGDVTDWITAGGTKAVLDELVRANPLWAPGNGAAHDMGTAVPPGGDEADAFDEPALANEAPAPPPMAPEAFVGPIGEFVLRLAPETEADPGAILISALVAYGNAEGRHLHTRIRDTLHYCNLFAVIVGGTSDGRKGLGLDSALAFLRDVDEFWLARMMSGFGSGEGLITAVRDPQTVTNAKGTSIIPGVDDKRLFVVETEFAKLLDTAHRQGSILSSVVRQAWETGNLTNLTKNSPVQATGAHVSVLAHITPDELRAKLAGTTDMLNGFANRFLFIRSQRTQLLPFGGNPVVWSDLATRLHHALDELRHFGDKEASFSHEAAELWVSVYPGLVEDPGGIVGAATARGAAHVQRLALVYAAAEGVPVISLGHLRAALAVWAHSSATCRWIFGGADSGSVFADRVYSVLLDAEDGAWVPKADLFARFSNLSARDLDEALGLLLKKRRVEHTRTKPDKGTKGGRPRELWRAR